VSETTGKLFESASSAQSTPSHVKVAISHVETSSSKSTSRGFEAATSTNLSSVSASVPDTFQTVLASADCTSNAVPVAHDDSDSESQASPCRELDERVGCRVYVHNLNHCRHQFTFHHFQDETFATSSWNAFTHFDLFTYLLSLQRF
jgi:hypothetical protein